MSEPLHRATLHCAVAVSGGRAQEQRGGEGQKEAPLRLSAVTGRRGEGRGEGSAEPTAVQRWAGAESSRVAAQRGRGGGRASQPNANVGGGFHAETKEKKKKAKKSKKKSIQPKTIRRIRIQHEQESINQLTAHTTALTTSSRIDTHNFGCILSKLSEIERKI